MFIQISRNKFSISHDYFMTTDHLTKSHLCDKLSFSDHKMLRVWIGGWRHVEHLDPTKAHTGESHGTKTDEVSILMNK